MAQYRRGPLGPSIRSIQSGRASAAKRRTWGAASQNSPPSSTRTSCTTKLLQLNRAPRQPAARPRRCLGRPHSSGLSRRAGRSAVARRGISRRYCRHRRPRSGNQPLHRAGPLLQRFPRDPDAPPCALAPREIPQRFCALPAKPFVIGIPVRHQSGCENRSRHFPRPRDGTCRRRDGGDRG